LIARSAGVSRVTVSRVVNGTRNVDPQLVMTLIGQHLRKKGLLCSLERGAGQCQRRRYPQHTKWQTWNRHRCGQTGGNQS
jgi:hypothetical protein